MFLNNLNFNIEIHGQGDPFIWAHGIMSSIEHENRCGFLDWNLLVNTSQLIRYDARGHGKSEATNSPADYHWSNLADDMIAIADRYGLNEFIAGGHSMGCATSLYAALKAPDRIKALVLMNPPTAWESRVTQGEFYERMAAMIEKSGIAALVQLFKAYPAIPAWQLAESPELNSYFLDSVRQFNPEQLATVLRGAKLCDLPAYEALKQLTVPTLVFCWIDDPTHPIETAAILSNLIPNSQLIFARNMTDVARWSKLIQDYLSK